MNIKRRISIEATPEAVWRILAEQYEHVDRWASSVAHATARMGGPKPDAAPIAGRVCETELGPFSESIVEYDEERKVLAYQARGEKMPFFVKDLQNRWSLHSAAGDRTEVGMLMTAKLQFPFNLFMPPLMKLQMGRILSFAVEELKHYAETGEPHPRKARAALQAGRAAA